MTMQPYNGSRRVLPGAATSAIAVALLLCAVTSCQRDQRHLEVAARILAPAIRECSGIVASRQHDGVFWVHNDSGNTAQLFAIDANGELLCTVDVEGASNTDWEDVTTDDNGNLYVGDFGNNRNDRRNLEVLVLSEPDPSDCAGGVASVELQRRIPFRFPEQTGFPDAAHMNFDVEALFWLDGRLYVFTKHRSDGNSVLYRLPSNGGVDAERVDAFDAGGMVTAATVSPDGRRLLVLSYRHLDEFTLQPGTPLLRGAHRRLLLEARQCEAVAFDGDAALVVNEQREIYRLPLTPWRDSWLPDVPVLRVEAAPESAPQDVTWSRLSALPLVPEFEQGRPPTMSPPELKLTRSRRSLYARVRYGPPALPQDVAGSLVVVHVGPDADRQAYVASPEDAVLEITRSRGAWRVEQPADTPSPTAARVVQQDSALCLQWPLSPSLAQAARLRVNVIVRRPGDAGMHEWAWGGTSSARPGDDALLWGRLEMRPGS